MEIIDELEPSARHLRGRLGISPSPRHGSRHRDPHRIIKGNVLYAQAAAGIVADSVLRTSGRRRSQGARSAARGEQVETASTRSDAMLLMIDNYDSFTYTWCSISASS